MEKVADSQKFWLNYFNNYLYGKGLITEDERNKMSFIIEKEKNKTL